MIEYIVVTAWGACSGLVAISILCENLKVEASDFRQSRIMSAQATEVVLVFAGPLTIITATLLKLLLYGRKE